jgi:hypothetical protein
VDARTSLDTTWQYFLKPQGGYTASALSLAANPALAGAVLASICFAGIVAFLLTSVLVRVLRAGQREFATFVGRQEQMANMRQLTDGVKKHVNIADALHIKRTLPTTHETSIGYFSAVRFWYLMKLRPKLVNSLEDFISTTCTVYDDMTPSPLYSIASVTGFHWLCPGTVTVSPTNKRFKMPVHEFLKKYDLHCQARGYKMRDLGESAWMLRAAYGVAVKTERIAVLRGIKFKVAVAAAGAAHSASVEQFGDNWLHFFVHEQCQVTNVLSDVISEGDFVDIYTAFCSVRRGPTAVPTREELASVCKSLEVSQERHFVIGLCWTENAPQRKKTRPSLKDLRMFLRQRRQARFRAYGIFLREVFLTAIHALMIVGPPMPVILLALWVQSTYNVTHGAAALNGADFGTLGDFFHRPWILIRESSALLVENQVRGVAALAVLTDRAKQRASVRLCRSCYPCWSMLSSCRAILSC